MDKWNKTCYSFKRVRNLLKESIRTASHCMKIMYAMENCCDELTPDSEAKWLYYDDFRDLKSEIHEEVELMDENDYGSCEDTVNYYLDELYNLCDSTGVWLEL